jgi:hypothetical protein
MPRYKTAPTLKTRRLNARKSRLNFRRERKRAHFLQREETPLQVPLPPPPTILDALFNFLQSGLGYMLRWTLVREHRPKNIAPSFATVALF